MANTIYRAFSQLTSDQPTRLDKWTARDEAELREARQHIEQSEVRRELAVQRVVDALMTAGVASCGDHEGGGLALALLAIRHADAIRDALAPFDSGVRLEEKP